MVKRYVELTRFGTCSLYKKQQTPNLGSDNTNW